MGKNTRNDTGRLRPPPSRVHLSSSTPDNRRHVALGSLGAHHRTGRPERQTDRPPPPPPPPVMSTTTTTTRRAFSFFYSFFPPPPAPRPHFDSAAPPDAAGVSPPPSSARPRKSCCFKTRPHAAQGGRFARSLVRHDIRTIARARRVTALDNISMDNCARITYRDKTCHILRYVGTF